MRGRRSSRVSRVATAVDAEDVEVDAADTMAVAEDAEVDAVDTTEMEVVAVDGVDTMEDVAVDVVDMTAMEGVVAAVEDTTEAVAAAAMITTETTVDMTTTGDTITVMTEDTVDMAIAVSRLVARLLVPDLLVPFPWVAVEFCHHLLHLALAVVEDLQERSFQPKSSSFAQTICVTNG